MGLAGGQEEQVSLKADPTAEVSVMLLSWCRSNTEALRCENTRFDPVQCFQVWLEDGVQHLKGGERHWRFVCILSTGDPNQRPGKQIDLG